MIGTVTEWHHIRGFGFIHSDSGEQVFAHIYDFPERQAPTVGTRVKYQLGRRRGDGRPIAINIQVLATEQKEV